MVKKLVQTPHVVVLGAGASIAAFNHWGKTGKTLPSMDNFIDVLSLRSEIEDAGFQTDDINFESFYDDLVSTCVNQPLRELIDNRVYEYFSSLDLPGIPTIYDYLILSLREKDMIATFNWDPFLLQAFMRNERVSEKRRPRIAFLHGNVEVGVCQKDRISGVNGRVCSKCGSQLSPSQLLYPVKHKDYNSDPHIKGEWNTLRNHLEGAFFLTIFGYSAPTADVEARKLMLDVWKKNKFLNYVEVEIVEIRQRAEVEANWRDFFIRNHYMVTKDIFHSYLFLHPRRSCDSFFHAAMMCKPFPDNRFPQFSNLEELQEWVRPLIEEEIAYEEETEDPIDSSNPKSGKVSP